MHEYIHTYKEIKSDTESLKNIQHKIVRLAISDTIVNLKFIYQKKSVFSRLCHKAEDFTVYKRHTGNNAIVKAEN